MELPLLFALVGGLAVAVGLVSRPLRDLPLTEPLLALAAGIVIGPGVLGLVALDQATGHETLRISAELAVAMSVMAVALRFPPDAVRRQLGPLALLLAAGMAGMAVASTAITAAALGVAPAAAVLLGTIITPTDPVLASSVVEGDPANRQLPERVRLLLSLESGANDGLAAPMVMVAAATTVGVLSQTGRAAGALVVSVLIGGLIGGVTGRLLLWSERHRDLEQSAFLALTLALTAMALGTATLAGGVGVLAVFVAGVAYSRQIARSDRVAEWEVQEAINRYLVLPVFVLLGVTAPWGLWWELGWPGLAFVGATLALRRLPLLLVLRRPLRLSLPEALFMGWFGPIGVAALLYLAEHRAAGGLDDTVWAAGTLLIAASTLVHGSSAAPGRRLLARRRT